MLRVRVLGKGGRITGGVFFLLVALGTWSMIFIELSDLGGATLWDLWSGASLGSDPGLPTVPTTTAYDFAFGVLLFVGVGAAFTGSRLAGGLLAATTVLLLTMRLPVLWSTFLYTDWIPWYDSGRGDSDAVAVAGVCAVWTLLFTVPVAIALLAGLRPVGGRPVPGAPPLPPGPDELPMRPAKGPAAATAVILGLVALIDLSWNVVVLVEVDGDYLTRAFTGEGTISALLSVGPAWRWTVLGVLFAVGAVLAGTRRLPARGFAMALALFVLPDAAAHTVTLISEGRFFELSDVSPKIDLLNRVQWVLESIGSIAVIVLMGRAGERVGAGAPPFPAQQGPPGGWQQPAPTAYWPPAPGGHGSPVPPPIPPQAPPGGGYGYPAPPQNAPLGSFGPSQGSFGPPPGPQP